MADTTVIHGYTLPQGIGDDGLVAGWLGAQGPESLGRLDRGDDLDPSGLQARPADQQLDRVEILQGVLDAYETVTKTAARAGVAGNWSAWENALAEKDRLAAGIRELGWNPVFHISDRDYNRRMVELIRETLPTEERSLWQLYSKAQYSWQRGGLCLGYPFGARMPDLATLERHTEFSAEEAVAACKTQDIARWGDCTETSLKVLALLASAAAFLEPAARGQILWTEITDTTYGQSGVYYLIGHAFVHVRTARSTIAYDPSDIGFQEPAPARYRPTNPWRGAMADYHLSTGAFINWRHDAADAEAAIRAAIALDARRSTGFVVLGDLQVAQGKWDAAAIAYQRAFALHPDGAAGLTRMAELAMHHRDWQHAEKIYGRLADQFPELDTFQIKLGRVYVAQSRWADAERAFRNAMHTASPHPQALAGLGRVLLEQGKDQDAEEILHEVLGRTPGNAGARADLGTILARQGRYTAAKYWLERAMAIDPTSAYIQFRLGQYYLRTEEWKKAEAALRAALTLYPDDAETQDLLQRALAAQGKWQP